MFNRQTEHSQFKDLLLEERKLYFGNNNSTLKKMKKTHHKRYTIWRYLYYFRLCQYYRLLTQNSHRFSKLINRKIYSYYDKKRGVYSEKSGIEIGLQSQVGRCLDIWHSGVVINGVIGDYCTFHGNNIVGNKGTGKEFETPNIGNNVDIGAGAIIIGSIRIADNCKIGAGSVVTKSFFEKGAIIVGVPAKRV